MNNRMENQTQIMASMIILSDLATSVIKDRG